MFLKTISLKTNTLGLLCYKIVTKYEKKEYIK